MATPATYACKKGGKYFEVEKILSKTTSDATTKYCVQWKGYTKKGLVPLSDLCCDYLLVSYEAWLVSRHNVRRQSAGAPDLELFKWTGRGLHYYIEWSGASLCPEIVKLPSDVHSHLKDRECCSILNDLTNYKITPSKKHSEEVLHIVSPDFKKFRSEPFQSEEIPKIDDVAMEELKDKAFKESWIGITIDNESCIKSILAPTFSRLVTRFRFPYRVNIEKPIKPHFSEDLTIVSLCDETTIRALCELKFCVNMSSTILHQNDVTELMLYSFYYLYGRHQSKEMSTLMSSMSSIKLEDGSGGDKVITGSEQVFSILTNGLIWHIWVVALQFKEGTPSLRVIEYYHLYYKDYTSLQYSAYIVLKLISARWPHDE